MTELTDYIERVDSLPLLGQVTWYRVSDSCATPHNVFAREPERPRLRHHPHAAPCR